MRKPDAMDKCRTCTQPVARTAKTCPHCGQADPSLQQLAAKGRFWLWTIVLTVGVVGWYQLTG